MSPWCAMAGQTMDFEVQTTLDYVALPGMTIGLELFKDGDLVARSSYSNTVTMSSMYLFYRETIYEDSEFELFIAAQPLLAEDHPHLVIPENNI